MATRCVWDKTHNMSIYVLLSYSVTSMVKIYVQQRKIDIKSAGKMCFLIVLFIYFPGRYIRRTYYNLV